MSADIGRTIGGARMIVVIVATNIRESQTPLTHCLNPLNRTHIVHVNRLIVVKVDHRPRLPYRRLPYRRIRLIGDPLQQPHSLIRIGLTGPS